MRHILIITCLLVSVPAQAVPHLDLEMSSEEYAQLLNKHSSNKNSESDDPAITRSLKMGERLSKWIARVNASRPMDSAIRLTSPETRRGVPIDKPNVYSPKTIDETLKKILSDLPEAMKLVLTSNEDLPSTLSLDDETFILHARLIDRNYQSAARYKTVNPYRSHYMQSASKDVRGHYYLKENKIDADYLKDVKDIPASQLKLIKEALIRICYNKDSIYNGCDKKLDEALKKNELAAFYTKYFANSVSNWNAFFIIPNFAVRKDVAWTNNHMVVPFNTPKIPKFIPYLQDNIEDEFRFNDWSLKMNFGLYPNGPLLVFETGVVPHVNGLGGNQIVMDSNQPIEEYESQWTIRHEFGHVIGLPDCYHEFYDTNLEAYVNYQLDISDLMCSRAGNMNERIYTELKKVYGTK